MRIVVALGDGTLVHRGERFDAETQRRNVKSVVSDLAELAREHQLIVTHGNGPQVAMLALQAASRDGPNYPLDVLEAETEGMIGYLLEQELASELPDAKVAALLTQVVVDDHDTAFRRPTHPIGPVCDEETARRLAATRGWLFQDEAGGYRRLVPEPEPDHILELETLRILVDAGVLVVCAGGGGIPVIVDATGAIRGVPAVIDKDLSASLLATLLDADRLLLLTDIDAVYTDWGTPQARPLAAAHPAAIRHLGLPSSNMGPKAEAAARFAEATGRTAIVGALSAAADLIDGHNGTTVSTSITGLRWHTR